MKQLSGEFYCPACHTTFDLTDASDEECPSCGSLHVMLATAEIDE